jgi:hypothetical protein
VQVDRFDRNRVKWDESGAQGTRSSAATSVHAGCSAGPTVGRALLRGLGGAARQPWHIGTLVAPVARAQYGWGSPHRAEVCAGTWDDPFVIRVRPGSLPSATWLPGGVGPPSSGWVAVWSEEQKSSLLRSPLRSPFSLWLHLVLGVFGAASFATGVAAVFVTANGTGAAVLVGFGGIMRVLALLGDRIESLEFGGSRLRMRGCRREVRACRGFRAAG